MLAVSQVSKPGSQSWVEGYSPSGSGGFWESIELPLLRRLVSLLTDRLDLSFLWTLCDMAVGRGFLGCSVMVAAVAVLAEGFPHEHVSIATGLTPLPWFGPPSMPGWGWTGWRHQKVDYARYARYARCVWLLLKKKKQNICLKIIGSEIYKNEKIVNNFPGFNKKNTKYFF